MQTHTHTQSQHPAAKQNARPVLHFFNPKQQDQETSPSGASHGSGNLLWKDILHQNDGGPFFREGKLLDRKGPSDGKDASEWRHVGFPRVGVGAKSKVFSERYRIATENKRLRMFFTKRVGGSSDVFVLRSGNRQIALLGRAEWSTCTCHLVKMCDWQPTDHLRFLSCIRWQDTSSLPVPF